jgi:hypothetical protein
MLFSFLVSLSRNISQSKPMLGDFLIELFLTNEHSNYLKDSSKGKAAHTSRVVISKLVYRRGLDKYIKWSEGLAVAAIGRTCIGYFAKV